MRWPVIKAARRNIYMTVHIIAHTLGMTKDRKSARVSGMLFWFFRILHLWVIKEYMDRVARSKRVNPVHFEIGARKRSRNTMIKRSECASFYHCGPPTLMGVA